MPDTEFCLGPKEGYDPLCDLDDSSAQIETESGISVTETYERSRKFVCRMLQQLRTMLMSVMKKSETIQSYDIPGDEEFCCQPTEEWIDQERRLNSSQNFSDPQEHQCIVGNRVASNDSATKDSHVSIHANVDQSGKQSISQDGITQISVA